MCNSNSISENPPKDKTRTIGDAINDLVSRPDIDIYILERALAKRCFPDSNEYISVEVGGRLTCDSPGRETERQRTAEALARVEKLLAEVR